MTRSSIACAALVLLGLGLSGGCKRKETLAPVHLEEVDPVDEADVSLALAPNWGPPSVVALSNGLLLHWLTEEGRQTAHIRLMVSLHDHHGEPVVALVAAHALIAALERDLASTSAQIELAHRPGRFEVVVHIDDNELATAIGALALRLADKKSGDLYAAGLKRASKTTPPLDPDAAVANEVVARLLYGDESGNITKTLVGKDALSKATRSVLEKQWPLLFDPRTCLLVVHASGQPSRAGVEEALVKLGKDWTAAGITLSRGGEKDGVGRMTVLPPVADGMASGKKSSGLPAGLGLVGTKPFAGYVNVDLSGGRASVMLARLLWLPDAHARGLARLAQRVLQEEFDARLVMSGKLGLFAIRVPSMGGSPASAIQIIEQRLRALAKADESRERLRESAQLWLGARAVEASLQGEDWTSLWSESMDLCTEDNQVRGALAREGLEMLRADPEELRGFIDANLLLGKASDSGGSSWLILGTGVDPKVAQAAIEAPPKSGTSGNGNGKEKH